MIKSKMHCLNPRFLPAGALQQPWSRTPPASILIRSTTFPTSREVWPQNDLKSSYQHDEEQINSPAANKGYFHVLSGRGQTSHEARATNQRHPPPDTQAMGQGGTGGVLSDPKQTPAKGLTRAPTQCISHSDLAEPRKAFPSG